MLLGDEENEMSKPEVKRTTGSILYFPFHCNILSGFYAQKLGRIPFIPLSETSKSNTADDITSKSRALLVARQMTLHIRPSSES